MNIMTIVCPIATPQLKINDSLKYYIDTTETLNIDDFELTDDLCARVSQRIQYLLHKPAFFHHNQRPVRRHRLREGEMHAANAKPCCVSENLKTKVGFVRTPDF